MPSCHSVHDLELAVQDLRAHLPQDNIRDKADGPISFRSASEREVARLDFPGTVQRVYIRSEGRKDSLRGTTGSRPPSGVPRAKLLSYKRCPEKSNRGSINRKIGVVKGLVHHDQSIVPQTWHSGIHHAETTCDYEWRSEHPVAVLLTPVPEK
ncbi:hypothetical protein TNCV_460071 [Trichonephila clavipes]|nr:hypothetical protein TNCV_460071 [Trichonephila clavipes]